MKLRKRFDSLIEHENESLGRKEKFATVKLIEREDNEVDMLVRNFIRNTDGKGNIVDSNRSSADPEPVYRFRFENDRALRKMSNVISRFLSSKTKPALVEEINDVKYETLESAYRPGEDLSNEHKAEYLDFSIAEHRGRYVMWFSIHGEGKEIEFNISTSEKADENHDNLTDFLGFIQDFTQKGIFWDEKISWNELPKDLQNAKTKVESAEEKLFSNDIKGAAVELRDSFHALESLQKDLDDIDERKIQEIMRSANEIKDFALHTEQRDENVDIEDIELILGNFNNTVNYFANKCSKQDSEA